ncbi:inactive serine/threonine-protein kinase VRK3 isoform X1 [Corythoichthys intestinalis]|uniref:inactive serine/threonine-protein kinase VRK3 isoform X1 n=1 Tax=Corythoichthys intestinalis TaxID=161448 RepID=UPI0025A657C7|nr:inactive serine/threonine-protein kinase VRK3 isoform X1 [Corythoichthys intestinalis]
MEGSLERKVFRFCPECGTKLKPSYKYCPSCGEKIPCGADAPALESISSLPNSSPPKGYEPMRTNQASSISHEATDVNGSPSSVLRKTRNSVHLDREENSSVKDDSPPRTQDDSMPSPTQTPVKRVKKASPAEAPPPSVFKSTRSGRGRRSIAQSVEEDEKKPEDPKTTEESTVDNPPQTFTSPLPSTAAKSPFKAGQNKGKKLPVLERLNDGEELTDNTGSKWTLVKLLSQSATELVYEVAQKGSWNSSKESAFILKLGSERGRIYREQNFIQRAAKPISVTKWIRQHELDFLGIPSCVGFGHTDSYRFLVFPAMGNSLQLLIENQLLTEKTVLQLACRILDVLHYIHSNEYVHANINADSIYIRVEPNTEVYLVDYYHASRFCPGGIHVSYRQGSQELHEGSLEFISVDCHQRVVPSRRSDLQSLGYCMLFWLTGMLPWRGIVDPELVADLKQKYLDDVPALMSHCFGKNNISSTIRSYMETVSELQYTEQPDYTELKDRLSQTLSQLGGSVQGPLSF